MISCAEPSLLRLSSRDSQDPRQPVRVASLGAVGRTLIELVNDARQLDVFVAPNGSSSPNAAPASPLSQFSRHGGGGGMRRGAKREGRLGEIMA